MYMDEEEKRKHEQANVYKELCAMSDSMVGKPEGTEAYDGWKVVTSDKTNTNFKGVLYEKDGQYALCFVGTDKWSAKDHINNLEMGIKGESMQMRDADRFYEKIKDKYNLSPSNCVSIGHSEGGTEATYIGINNGIPTVTFNAYGLSKKLYDKAKDYSNLVRNYCDAHDPVSKLKRNIGKTYILESQQNKFMSSTPFGSLPAHGIKNMGDCSNAQLIDDYKKSHPLFLDRISDAEVTQEDIGEMETGLFGVYEKEFDNRMVNNQIPTRAEAEYKTSLGGTIYVNGYTRDDGTEVRGYYRRAAVV